MRHLLLLSIFTIFLNANSYLAKIEPYNFYKIKAEVTGVVSYVNKKKEFTYISSKTNIVKLDSTEEDISLKNLKLSLKIQNNILDIHQENFDNKFRVKHISKYEKNQEKLNLLNSRQSIIDLEKSIESLENQKDKKVFFAKDLYLNEVFVSKNEYVDVGEILYELYDFSKSKLIIFVRENEISNIIDKTVYINKNRSEFILEKYSKVRDNKRVSTYKVILSKENKDKRNINFGQIVKVEFK